MASGTKITEEDVISVKRRFSIIGNSPLLTRAIERAVKVAPFDLSVLVTGESGTGKEFFPKIIHLNGSRKHKKYIAVNCGAIPEGTIDSELFGHEKGSFTGAISARKGYFEEADGGTIFLDEVAELPMTTQARLLRVLETGEFLKVGSSVVQKTDIRIVAATNVNLIEAVAKGKFREDLYYRLSTVVINVPPLRDRGNDIALLARKFAADFSEKYMTAPITFSPEATRAMELYDWPGNVRQLKNIVEQLALFDDGKEISRMTLMESLPATGKAGSTELSLQENTPYESERQILWQMLLSLRQEVEELRGAREDKEENENRKPLAGLGKIDDGDEDVRLPKRETAPLLLTSRPLERAEKEVIAETLQKCGGDKKKAAEELGISQRTLYRKIKELEL